MKWTNKYISIYILSYQPDYNDLLQKFCCEQISFLWTTEMKIVKMTINRLHL